MTPKEKRHKELRQNLIDAAQEIMAREGISGLRARTLAQNVGCSLGAIYNVVDDMGSLAALVNIETFRNLGAFIEAQVAKAPKDDPRAQLIAMAEGYAEFAAENFPLWKSIFEVQLPDGQIFPREHVEETTKLFAMIEAPLSKLLGNEISDKTLAAKSFFAAVHGIVILAVDPRISTIQREQVPDMIRILLLQLT